MSTLIKMRLKIVISLNIVVFSVYCSSSNAKQRRYIESKIVGGRPVGITEFPSAVQFYNNGGICAGSVLNTWSILTAAHCFDVGRDVRHMDVHVGTTYLHEQTRHYAINHFVLHEEYNKAMLFACDIALIFVRERIPLSARVKKAVIVFHNKWMSEQEKNFYATGWGLTKYGGHLSEHGLLVARLRFIDREECNRMHQLNMTEDMFCLYGDAKHDTCKGDSGGGIFWKNFLVGITSHGDGCAGKLKPSVYTNVWHFRTWIERHVRKYFAENCYF